MAEPSQIDKDIAGRRYQKAVKAYQRAEGICFWMSRLRPLDCVLLFFFLLGVATVIYCLLRG